MKLKDWLLDHAESQAAFAARVDVHPITVTRWCSGQWVPRLEMVDRIAEATGGAVQWADLVQAHRDRAPPPLVAA